MDTNTNPLPRMFDLLKTMIAIVGEEVVDAAVTRVPDSPEQRDKMLATLEDGGRDIQILTEACAILIRRRAAA